MVVVDGKGIPLGGLIASASPAEVTLLEATLATIQVPRNGPGRPRSKPTRVIADRAYDSDALRETLAARGAWANVKPMARRKTILAFSSYVYRFRNLVERFFNKLKHFRALATRYDKNPLNFLAAIKFVAARISINTL